MYKILEKLNKINIESKKISLTKEEKSSVRNILISYSKKSPYYSGIISSRRLFDFVFLSNKKVLISAFIILILILGTGTSYAAEGSLPGDMLYPIKVNVNEQIAHLTSFTSESKAKLNTKIIKKRLEEADRLASKGKLNEVTKDKIVKGLEKASVGLDKDLLELIDKKDFKNISELNSILKISLDNHKKSLEEKAEEKNIKKDDIDFILEKINEKSEKNNRVKEDLDSFEEESGFLEDIDYEDEEKEIRELEINNFEIEKEISGLERDKRITEEEMLKINREDIRKQLKNTP